PLQRLTESHVLELMHRPRRQTVAARLVARERLALDHAHRLPGPAEPIRGRRPCGPTTDDEHVVTRCHHVTSTLARHRPKRETRHAGRLAPAFCSRDVTLAGSHRAPQTSSGRAQLNSRVFRLCSRVAWCPR